MNADLELAERAARAAGEVLMSYYGLPPAGLGAKSSETDLVSDADLEAERVIRELLEAERPGDGLIAEEGSRADAESGRRWVVDPLDGTINFLYGFPAWAVSIALEGPQGIEVGVVFDPVRPELYSAVRREGATLNGRPIRASGLEELARAMVATGFSYQSERRAGREELASAMVATGFSYQSERRAGQAELLLRVLPQVRDIRRAGAAALDLCLVAAGRVDAFYERGLMRWDEAAGRLIVEEAGGVVADLEGEPAGIVAAGSPGLLSDLYAIVNAA